MLIFKVSQEWVLKSQKFKQIWTRQAKGFIQNKKLNTDMCKNKKALLRHHYIEKKYISRFAIKIRNSKIPKLMLDR
jgi:hypothetical protein